MNKQEYKDYQERFLMYMEGIEFVSTGPCPGCHECDPNFVDEEPHYSGVPCEICNRPLGGNRVTWHGRSDGKKHPIHCPVDYLFHGTCCIDCAYYIEMGVLDDQTMLEIANSIEEPEIA